MAPCLEWEPSWVYLLPLSLAVLCWPTFGSSEVQHLCGNDVELELLPVVVGLFESLNISLRPRSHSLPQSFETHLQGRDLVELAQIGLKADGDVFPRQVLFLFQLEEKLLFLVEFHGPNL